MDFQAMPPQENLSIVDIMLEEAKTSERNLAKLFRITSLESLKKTCVFVMPAENVVVR